MNFLLTKCKLIFFLSLLLIIKMGIAPNLQASGILYKGVNPCGGRQVEISFVYNSSDFSIKDLKVIHSCVKELNNGKGTVTTTIDSPLTVKDNKFKISSVIEGIISSNGKASGKLLDQMQYMKTQCSDNKMYHNCVDWVADPQK